MVHTQACPPVGILVTVKLFEAVVDFGVPPVKKLVVEVSSLAVTSILTPAVGKVEALIATVTGKPLPRAAGVKMASFTGVVVTTKSTSAGVGGVGVSPPPLLQLVELAANIINVHIGINHLQIDPDIKIILIKIMVLQIHKLKLNRLFNLVSSNDNVSAKTFF